MALFHSECFGFRKIPLSLNFIALHITFFHGQEAGTAGCINSGISRFDRRALGGLRLYRVPESAGRLKCVSRAARAQAHLRPKHILREPCWDSEQTGMPR